MPILETDWQNTPLSLLDRGKKWTSHRVGGETFGTPKGPRFGWVPVHDPGTDLGGRSQG